MALPVVRAFPIYYGTKKIAEAHDNQVTDMAGRTALFGAEGYLTHSKGAVQCRITVRYVIPVAGTSVDLIRDCLNQKDIDIGIPMAGRFRQVTMAITENQMQTNTQTGVSEGTLTLEGGVPIVT